MPGADCILKALCETGQKRNDEKPGTFLIEILRAVFRYDPFFFFYCLFIFIRKMFCF